jgi:hypothetical protein
MRWGLTILLAICLSLTSFGQSLYYEPGFDVGHYTPFSEKHKYISDYQQYSLDFRVGRQTIGEKRWQQEYCYPSYGLLIGFTHNTLDSVVYYTHDGNRYGPIGECFSLAGFVNGPIYRGKNWSFDYDIIYGADLWTRYGNEMLGSALNFHVSFDLGPTIKLSEHLDLAARYLYYHSSNGATFLPDNGVNSHSVRLALRYHPQGRQAFIRDDREPFEKQNNWFISEGIGWLQTYTRQESQLPNETPFFIGNTLRFGFSRQFNPKFRWDVGFDFLWTGETRYCYELLGEPYNFWKSTHWALSADFEILFGRFAFCAGGAYYLYHGIYGGTDEHKSWGQFTEFEKDHLPDFYTPYYERVGYKLYLGRAHNFFVGTFMKIHLNSIDYIEWTFGVHLFQPS